MHRLRALSILCGAWVALLPALYAQGAEKPALLRGPVHPAGLLATDAAQRVVRVSVAPLRGEARHGAEQVDQVILGTGLEILEQRGGWSRARTPYGYEGWITTSSTSALDKGAKRWQPTHVYAMRVGDALAEPQPMSRIAIDLVLGALLKVDGEVKAGWAPLKLPDGRAAFVRETELVALSSDSKSPPSAEGVIALARSLRGLPYLWGGNSAKGFDCSGFTQTVFRLNGVALPRDASDQRPHGIAVDWKKGFDQVRAGDLLFFGPKPERITHVAISLGGPRFIHCATDVHEASMDPRDDDHQAERRSSLQAIQRVLPSGDAKR